MKGKTTLIVMDDYKKENKKILNNVMQFYKNRISINKKNKKEGGK